MMLTKQTHRQNIAAINQATQQHQLSGKYIF